MKLLYLYIEEYGLLKNTEFNFDSEYRFHYNNKNNELIGGKTEDPLPDDFFSIDKTSKSRVVESISALIGDNGAGKTTVARLLSTLTNSSRYSFIIIWKANGLFYETNLDLDIHNAIKGDFQESHQFIYNTNHYHPNTSQIPNHDLSSSNLLANDYKVYSQKIKKESAFARGIEIHSFLEVRRQLKFFLKFTKSSIDIPKPIFLKIIPNYDEVYSIIKFLESPQIKNDELEPLIKFFNSLKSKLSDDFFMNAIYCFIANFIRNNFSILTNQKWWSIVDGIDWNEKNPIAILTTFYNKFYSLNKQNEFKPKSGDEYENLKAKICNAINLIEHFYTQDPKTETKTTINIAGNSFETKETSFFFLHLQKHESILKSLNYYFESCSSSNYLNFSWCPDISSGEFAQLNIYSRLYSLHDEDKFTMPTRTKITQKGSSTITEDYIVKDMNDITDEEHEKLTNLIVFFDEIEITVHPEVQRGLVKNLITFFEEFFEGYKIHLIFASHSPVLLSDIPKSNVCFMERDNNTEPPTVKIRDNCEMENTFGANIHTLHRSSFFMKHGTAGQFATEKIKKILEHLESSGQDNSPPKVYSEAKFKEYQQVINIIGEPVVRNYLKQRLFSHKYFDKQNQIKAIDSEIERLRKIKKELGGE